MTEPDWRQGLVAFARGLTPQPAMAELTPAKRALAELQGIAMVRFFHEERAQLCAASDQRVVVWLTDELGLSAARELIIDGADDLVAMSPADFDHWLETSPDDDLSHHLVYASFVDKNDGDEGGLVKFRIGARWGVDDGLDRVELLSRDGDNWVPVEVRTDLA